MFQLFTSTLTLATLREAAETRLQRIKRNMSEINTTLPSECRLCPRFHSGNTAETSRPSWFVFTLQGFKICIRSCLYRKQRKNCCNALFFSWISTCSGCWFAQGRKSGYPVQHLEHSGKRSLTSFFYPLHSV